MSIRDRLSKATLGPWHDEIIQEKSGSFSRVVCDNSGNYDRYLAWYMTETDAEFIAHARTDIPALLEAGDEMRMAIYYLQDIDWECNPNRFIEQMQTLQTAAAKWDKVSK